MTLLLYIVSERVDGIHGKKWAAYMTSQYLHKLNTMNSSQCEFVVVYIHTYLQFSVY